MIDPIANVFAYLVHGRPQADILRACAEAGVAEPEAERLIAEARKRILLAATFERAEEVGKAVERLTGLYRLALAEKDTRGALGTQKEINRLLGLYGPSAPDAGSDDHADADDMRRTLAAVRGHLVPLALADAGYPLEEHARLAADVVRRARAT